MAKAFRRRKGTGDAPIRVDLNGAMAAVAGPASGIGEGEIAELLPRLREALASLQKERDQGLRPFLDLDRQRRDVEAGLAVVERLRDRFDHVVMLGVGGSILGARALASALAPAGGRPGPGRVGLVSADSIDPTTVAEILDGVDLRRTLFNVVSKSGETPETMAHFLLVRERLLREVGALDYTRHLLVTTDDQSGSLRQIVNDEGFNSLSFPVGVAGRFSVLSAVHLVPASFLEIDIDKVLEGAAAMEERCREPDPEKNSAAMLAAAHYLLETLHGIATGILMPYSDRLRGVADWWCQLWAESLGRCVERDGAVLAMGQTPLALVGAREQHALMQLLTQGPADKVVTMIRVEDHEERIEVPRSYPDIDDVEYLGGRTLGDLLNIEQRASEIALANSGRPTITIEMSRVGAHEVGQLLYLLEVEAALVGALHGLDPCIQPGVDEARCLTFAMAGRRGYEEQREQVETWQRTRQPRYLL